MKYSEKLGEARTFRIKNEYWRELKSVVALNKQLRKKLNLPKKNLQNWFVDAVAWLIKTIREENFNGYNQKA